MICIAADLAITGGTLIVLNGCEVLNEDVDEKKQFGLKTDDLKIYEVFFNILMHYLCHYSY